MYPQSTEIVTSSMDHVRKLRGCGQLQTYSN